MKVGQFRTYMISLLLVLAICGARVASAWDFSDNHDSHALHIDHAVPYDNDMDDVKHKLIILPNITIDPYVIPLPNSVACILTPTAVQFIHPLLHIVLSLPSRASPV